MKKTQEHYEKYEAEQIRKEIRAKEDAFMKSFSTSSNRKKRDYFE